MHDGLAWFALPFPAWRRANGPDGPKWLEIINQIMHAARTSKTVGYTLLLSPDNEL